MFLGEIKINQDGYCLLCHKDTVYKIKVIFSKQILTCDEEEFRSELEKVCRAVLNHSGNNESIKPLYTQHLMVKPAKNYWSLSDQIVFQQNGKDLVTSSFFFQFHISDRPVWNTTRNEVLTGTKSSKLQHRKGSEKQVITKQAKTRDKADQDCSTEHDTREKVRTGTNTSQIKVDSCSERKIEGKDKSKGIKESGLSDSDVKVQRETRSRSSKKGSNTRNHCVRSAVTELSQSGITDLDIEADAIKTTGCPNTRKRVRSISTETALTLSGITDLDTSATESDTIKECWKKKKETPANVDDITGFSYKVRKFQAKISNQDSQTRRKGQRTLYRAAHPPLQELPGKDPEETTSVDNKTRSQLKKSTSLGQNLAPEEHTRRVLKEKSCFKHVDPTDSEASPAVSLIHSTSDISEHKNVKGHPVRRSKPDGSRSPQGSALIDRSTSQLHVVPRKRERIHTRSSELSNDGESILSDDTIKRATGSLSAAKGQTSRGQMRSETPTKQLRGYTPLKGQFLSETPTRQLRGHTPLKGHKGQVRSETPIGKLQGRTQLKGHKGQSKSNTPLKVIVSRKKQLRSSTSSKGRRLSTLSSKSSTRQLRSQKTLEQSTQMLRAKKPTQKGIQLTEVDRYLVEQEDLREESRLQRMAGSCDQQSGEVTKRSGLWNYVIDSLIITPAKKLFKRM